MKVLDKKLEELAIAGRWDIDFHLPAEGIRKFPQDIVVRIHDVADVMKFKRDPGRKPDDIFQYIDIASVDVAIGVVSNPQELRGDEAPSRARKVVRAFDVIVSTCRPTRGAIAVIPVELHDQIASTAFSIVRAKDGINPFYLHYALRLPSTLEQFRKWSTGSSYPAILDEDVKKTLIPLPIHEVQDQIAQKILAALHERDIALAAANAGWNGVLDNITNTLCGHVELSHPLSASKETISTIAQVRQKLSELPQLNTDGASNGNGSDLFDEMTDE
ncbi:MAG: restriction endonuclease subunit S [Nostoc sp. JL31]|uniref:restriction endonuclease subunit S n=1 Tax=Nostoc sp. JL31 TaxID=2815395 RepID=UPI0025F517CB|nr:restriction endonuclease subunit S [Nostoc sp. JL31]MBN3890293.1 restriction endonuclease subunit S [Nostoc sp. JL31]